MGFMGILGILGQVEAATLDSGDQNFINLVLHANTVVQLTLLLLVLFSVVSWAIIGSKHRQLKKAREGSTKFYSAFWQAKNLEQFMSKGGFRKSPAFNVFKAGVDTLRENQTPEGATAVEKEIRRAAEDEIEQMEYGVPFLATTGSAAPFIGLFGTVWGILNAFWKIGRTGTTSLAIVGPHIAEALIATAIGLAAAIPAVIFYNVYINKIRLISKDLDNFTDDLVGRFKAEYFKSE
jgi:biopolymer transport protein TolQ